MLNEEEYEEHNSTREGLSRELARINLTLTHTRNGIGK